MVFQQNLLKLIVEYEFKVVFCLFFFCLFDFFVCLDSFLFWFGFLGVLNIFFPKDFSGKFLLSFTVWDKGLWL